MSWTFYNSTGSALTSLGRVAVSDLANGTDGQLITWGTDAVATTVAAGSSGQVLTSGGAGAVPSFQTASAPSQAVQADLEAETNENTYAPPDLMKHHPGVAKVWASFEQIGAHGLNQSYNVTSVTDGGGVGDSDFVWNIDFANANYAAIGGAGTSQNIGSATPAAGTLRVLVKAVADGANEDTSEGFIMGLGTQV